MPNPERQLKREESEAKEIVAEIGGATEASESHPDRNEDTAFFNQEKMTAGVLDGMGGGMAGEKASRLAGQMIARELKKIPEGTSSTDCERIISTVIESAHEAVLKLGNNEFFQHLDREEWKKETGNLLWDDPAAIDKEIVQTGWKPKSSASKKFKGKNQAEIFKALEEAGFSTPTATTASIAKLIERPDGGTDMVYGHVGDSRIYVLKKDGKIEQVTKDQGGFEEAIKPEIGILTKEEADTLEQATDPKILEQKFGKDRAKDLQKFFPQLRRSVTQGLGLTEKISPQIGVVKLEAGERVLFTSDGVHDNLTNQEIEQLLKGGSSAEAAQKIVAAAMARTAEGTMRSKRDDKTAVVLEAPEAIEEISAEEITEEPEEIGVEEIEVVPIAQLEAEDRRKSAKKIKEIKRAIGM